MKLNLSRSGLRRLRRSAPLQAGILLLAGALQAQTPDPIRYTLRFPEPATHYVEVEAEVPTAGRGEIELMMAVWTPGSYLVREYARHVEAVEARAPDGRPLPVEKSAKNRWRVTTGDAPRVRVAYRVYGREMSVRTNWIEAEFAVLNGAPTFLTLAGDGSRPHDVRLELPPGWRSSHVALPPPPDGGPNAYRAADFDTLVDSPIVAGTPEVYEFLVDDTPHALVNVGGAGVWDGPRSVRDVESLVREHRRMWGFLPYDRYLFLNILTGGGGGLEHKSSTLLMTSRWRTREPRAYLGWLGLVSHEFFHTWNIKRLRPIELGPFDYEDEVYTRSLWMGEGVTDYYADLAVHRAGLSTQAEYLDALSGHIEQLQTTPGRLVQPVERASFDAWIRQYRPDENSPNVSISYYTKGAVVAFLLDARIREATGGRRSLDDVMREAYLRYAGERGFTPEEFRAIASDVAGVDLSAWLARALETTEELEYDQALAWYGLRFRPLPAHDDKTPPRGWLGLRTRTDEGRLVVAQVRRGTPAYEAGFNVGDELLAVDQFRVRPDDWSRIVGYHPPGSRVRVIVARHGVLTGLEVTLGEEPRVSWQLEPDPAATPAQQARLAAWLKPQG